MSRSGYSDFCDGWRLIRWRGAVASAIRGKRGQAFLHELIEALDAMPDKSLTVGELQDENGNVCALGAVALKRGLDIDKIDTDTYKGMARTFDIAWALIAEIMFENDEWANRSSKWRWSHMRQWAEAQIRGRPECSYYGA